MGNNKIPKIVGNSYLYFVKELGDNRFLTTCSLCGMSHEIRKNHFMGGAIMSCGCLFSMKPPKVDHTGEIVNGICIYGYFGDAKYKVIYSCGHSGFCEMYQVRQKKSSLCNHCISQKVCIERNTTHGMAKSKTYNSWLNMKNRCNDPSHNRYHLYGGRGISYDPRWESFENFYEDMGVCPEDMSLDRIDVNGNYCKDNCRWTTDIQQANNKRNNILITNENGVVWSLRRWCIILGKDYKRCFHLFRYDNVDIPSILGKN